MERQRAERTLAEAPAVARQAEAHLRKRRDTARPVVGGMRLPRVRQRVDGVHLLGGKRRGGRVLHDVLVVGVRLDQAPARERVAVAVLHGEAARVRQPIRLQLGKRRQLDRVVDVLERRGAVHRAVDEGDVADRKPRRQRVGDLDDRMLAHAVDEQVRPRVEQKRALHLVGPVVVVRQAPQARLDAAHDDGRLLEGAADEVGVHDRRVVGTQARLAAGGIRVAAALLLGDGVVVDHRVHVARRHEEPQARFAEHGDGGGVVPVGLRDHAHLIAVRLEQASDDGHPERGMIDVRVARHVHEIATVPSAPLHVGSADGKESFWHAGLLGRTRLSAGRGC